MSERWYEYWFANVKGISAARKAQIRQNVPSAEALYYIEETEKIVEKPGGIRERTEAMKQAEISLIRESRGEHDWKVEYQNCCDRGIRLVTRQDAEYPRRFLDLPGMPYALYVKGKLPDEERKAVAVVGARRCTPYGERMTLKFAETLAENGVRLISGMARGIDGAAQRGALNAGGQTFAVLGCGVDVCYPREHKGLYEDIQRDGGVISEYPPGFPPLPANFPARNRIISGLSDVVLVMEAKEKSGSLITADMALEQGRDVYALPGPIESALSAGCNRLIRQGAGILLSPQDLLEEMQITPEKEVDRKRGKAGKNKIMLESGEILVYTNLGLYPKSREELLQLTGLSARELTAHLVSLELKGYIEERSKNYYIRSR